MAVFLKAEPPSMLPVSFCGGGATVSKFCRFNSADQFIFPCEFLFLADQDQSNQPFARRQLL
ncbi:MAG TPA: hypothetical protein VFS89_00565, partial [Nitrosospira sp.]|nr:hypothetical protein [Nitrosospira sp.]